MKNKKPVEWKDTNTFSFTPKYQYPTIISNRYVFVWDLGKSFKKAINYAKNFLAPNKIVYIYLVGKVNPELLNKRLSEIDGNIIVSVFADSEIVNKIIESEQQLDRITKWGYTKESLQDDISRLYKTIEIDRKEYEYLLPQVEQMEQYLSIVNNHPKLLQAFNSKWNEGLQTYGLRDFKISGEQERHFAELINIAKEVYPLGIECGTEYQLSFKTARREKLVISALNSKSELKVNADDILEQPKVQIDMYNSKTNELLNSYDSYRDASKATGIKENAIWRVCTGVSKSTKYKDSRVYFKEKCPISEIPKVIVQMISEQFHREILDRGFVDMFVFKEKISNPPIGYYECNWYTYLFALAMRRYIDDKYHCFVYCASFDLSFDNLKHLIVSSVNRNKRNYRNFLLFKQTVAQTKYIRLLRKLFQIPTKYKTYSDLSVAVAKWCEKHIAIANLDYIDSRLFHIVNSPYKESISVENCKENWKANRDNEAISYGYEENYDWLKNNYDAIKYKIEHCDEALYNDIVKEYGEEKTKLYFKHHYHVPISRSWCWSKNYLLREIREFMNGDNIYCRECDRRILDNNAVETPTDKSFLLSKKDVIGINRKLFSEKTNQFYCPECLCDVLGCEMEDIVYKIEQFKEEGCKLFA